jgi:hypothetical protein
MIGGVTQGASAATTLHPASKEADLKGSCTVP